MASQAPLPGGRPATYRRGDVYTDNEGTSWTGDGSAGDPVTIVQPGPALAARIAQEEANAPAFDVLLSRWLQEAKALAGQQPTDGAPNAAAFVVFYAPAGLIGAAVGNRLGVGPLVGGALGVAAQYAYGLSRIFSQGL